MDDITVPPVHGGIIRLGLQNFRNYAQEALSIAAKHVVLTGANGIGKTNILEAISLLAPGRGLRQARPADWVTGGHGREPWGISLTLADQQRLTTRSPADKPQQARRLVQHQGVNLNSQAELAEYLAVIWLTPQMDGLFLAEAAARRKFFDRLVYAYDPDHAVRLYRYEHALRQRNRLLKDRAAPSLIRSLHPVLVAEGVAIAAARLESTEQLNRALTVIETPFSLPVLRWVGQVEEWLHEKAALTVEQLYRDTLEAQLEHDRVIGQTRLGVHRSDMETIHRQKNIPAAQCSTGEQKALLLALVLAHAQWLKHWQPQRPLILLLDDIAAYLDENRRRDVFAWIASLPAQAWLTGTDRALFASLDSDVQHIGLPLA